MFRLFFYSHYQAFNIENVKGKIPSNLDLNFT
jgi:hypothetical protein